MLGQGRQYRVKCWSWVLLPCTVLHWKRGGAERKICLKLFCRPTFLLIHLQEASHFKGSTEERNIFPLRSFKRKGPLDRKEILVIQLSRVQCTQRKKKKEMKVLAEP